MKILKRTYTIVLTILLFLLLFTDIKPQGNTESPFDTTGGWDDPEEFTIYYGLPIYRLLSNPGGWINYSQFWIDSLLHELIVYTDTSEMYIENDTLKIREAYGRKFINESDPDTIVIAGTGITYPIQDMADTTSPGVDSLYKTCVSLSDSSIGIRLKANYIAHFNFDLDISAAMTLLIHIYKNNVEMAHAGSFARVGGAEVQSVSVTCFEKLNYGDVLDIKLRSTSGTGTVIIQHGSFFVNKFAKY